MHGETRMSEAIPQDIDKTRIDGLNSIAGVAFAVGKEAEDLQEIEELPTEGAAFHKNAQGTGFYFVDTEARRCSCPSFKFQTGLIRGVCKHLRAVGDRQQASKSLMPREKANFAAAW